MPPVLLESPRSLASSRARVALGSPGRILAALTVLALCIEGYHPYAEDAGIYVPAIKLSLHPQLYRHSAPFLAAYSHMSLFVRWNVLVVRATHLPLAYVLFATQILTIWLLLFACHRIACQCFSSREEQIGAVVLVALCLSVPVAGTSLFPMDPYVISRSFSTPLTFLAIDACLRRWRWRSLLWVALALCFHPLMGIYSLGFVLLLWMAQRRSWWGVLLLMMAAVVTGTFLQFSQRGVVEPLEYKAAVLTRYYYFLSEWHWYELFGLAAPLFLFGLFCLWKRNPAEIPAKMLSLACLLVGTVAVIIALLFGRPGNSSYLVASIQTVRSFLILYIVMFLLLGGVLARYVLQNARWRWAVLIGSVASLLTMVSLQTYPTSPHLELPWMRSTNPWEEAFVWIRQHTPVDTVVALDSDYIHAPDEDAQGFRAIAERSSLADSSKDGGVAAVFPELAHTWMIEQSAQTGLSRISDAERERRLAPFDVQWVVLQKGASTAWRCPFQNVAVKVCRMP